MSAAPVVQEVLGVDELDGDGVEVGVAGLDIAGYEREIGLLRRPGVHR